MTDKNEYERIVMWAKVLLLAVYLGGIFYLAAVAVKAGSSHCGFWAAVGATGAVACLLIYRHFELAFVSQRDPADDSGKGPEN